VSSVATGSPPTSVATYKAGNYFRFPEIETPPVVMQQEVEASTDVPTTTTTVHRRTFESLTIGGNVASEKESIILKIDEVETPEKSFEITKGDDDTGNNNNNNNNNNNTYENTLTIRRARLKSISLDSDGARLVEENLTMPVEELVEIASSAYSKQICDSENDVCAASTTSACANNNNRFNPKNIYNLTINLDYRDNSLSMCSSSASDINMNQRHQRGSQQSDEEGGNNDDDDERNEEDGLVESEIGCRTPTMKYFTNKKAVSLDSDQTNQTHQASNQRVIQHGCKMASSETFNYYFGQSANKNSSISVPSTPKHLTTGKLKLSTSEDRSGGGHIYGRYSSRKLGSFEENPDDSHSMSHVSSQQVHQTTKSSLTASFQTLNVSSSNLKTLPEIMSINDFDQQSVRVLSFFFEYFY
jgi:hypothetical protein